MIINVIYVLIIIFSFSVCCGTRQVYSQGAATKYPVNTPDASATLPLLNGRIWHNKYSNARGNPYFLSDEFLKGSVHIDGIEYNGVDLRFDICNDELLLRIENKPVIIMNKEMVDSFSLFFEGKFHHIINAGNETSGILKGYVNVLYGGPTKLYAKYSKIIYPLGAEGRYDLFYQGHRVFIMTDTGVVPVKRKKELMNLLGSERKEINDHLRRNRIRITWKDPSTLVPVVEYFDKIRK